MAIAWNYQNAAHLLRRAGFGPRPEEVTAAVAAGLDATVDALFDADPAKAKYPGTAKKPASLVRLQQWWVRRMLKTTSPLVEKMVLFWHNHFATGLSKVVDPRLMFEQNATLRKHALGSFFELVAAIARDPAMLIWLDGVSNVKSSPNLNFARELMELFTTGVYDATGKANYTESDVKEGARAFTGWSLEHGNFKFKPELHDFGNKNFKGVSGPLNGDTVVQILTADFVTARRIAWKLFSFFARPVDLADPVIDPLVDVYKQQGGSIGKMLKKLFRMDAFYAPQSLRTRVKSPTEIVVGAYRQLRCKVSDEKKHGSAIVIPFHQIGQVIFDPPSVFGWDEGLAWITTGSLMERARFANQVAIARPDDNDAYSYKLEKLLGPVEEWPALDSAAVVARCLEALSIDAPSQVTIDALVAYLHANDAGNPVAFTLTPESADKKVRGLVALALSSPEYQFA